MANPRPTQMWAKARAAIDARDCPRCGRTKGNACRNLRTATWREGADISIIALPHPERYGDEQRIFDYPRPISDSCKDECAYDPGVTCAYHRGAICQLLRHEVLGG